MFREVEKLILQDGWHQVNRVGSHRQYKCPVKSEKVTIPERENAT
jgi:predicted RNA binding protein YcfA (HicA-like mRNA interferase family)